MGRPKSTISLKERKHDEYLKNRDSYSERHRLNHIKNREQHLAAMKEWRAGLSVWEKTYYAIERRCAKGGVYGKRGIQNFLTVNIIRYLWYRDHAFCMDSPSIDRIQGGLSHYTRKNCRFIELRENCRRNYGKR